MKMEMDERKVKILKAIIQTYLETGEPVGSRTVSKYSDLNLSSATIRNEMADLEELGYIIQPHTSAGRIPSDKGYRFYVDALMENQQREVHELKELMIERQDKMEKVLKQVAKVLASNTNYAAMITSPQYNRSTIKCIQLTQMDERQVLAVIVLEGNIVKNKMLSVPRPLDHESLFKLNILLNTSLNGLSIESINLDVISRMKEEAGIHSELVSDILDAVAQVIHEEEDVEVFTSGATNIFKYPELADQQRASELISTLEEKQELASLISKEFEDDDDAHDIQVYIGSETPVPSMKDCSVVTANYDLGKGMRGVIGIIGPKRMDYENVVNTLKTLMIQLDQIYKRSEGDKGNKAED